MPKVLLILAEGFEEIEALAPVDALRRAEIEVVIAGLQKGNIKSSRNVVVVPDKHLDEVDPSTFDMVVLPGGKQGTDNLAADERVKKIVQKMNQSKKYVTAICAAPYVLSQAGVLKDKKVTSTASMQSKLAAKEVLPKEKVVLDGNVVTSQGPGTSIEFGLKLVEVLKGKEKADEVGKSMLVR